jgi:uncharacterized protein
MEPAQSVVVLGQLLRDAGVPVGTDRVTSALIAVELVGWNRRSQIKDALQACFLSSCEDYDVFSTAFDLVFGDTDIRVDVLTSLDEKPNSPINSLGLFGQALGTGLNGGVLRQPEAVGGISREELLLNADFASLDASQLGAARKLLDQSSWTWPLRRSRRWQARSASTAGSKLSLRATLQARASLLGAVNPRYQSRKMRARPVVCLLDVSSSMIAYSAIFFYFLHALALARNKAGGELAVFAFGTRLTRISNNLLQRDVDSVIPDLQRLLADANAGTRIASSLRQFNEEWSAKVLSREAIVLLITDGLEQDAGEGLSQETKRLQAKCRSLIWLNPLLRYHGFEPRARGVKAMLRHVDQFLPVHNVSSLRDLLRQLESPTEILQGKLNRWK